MKMLLITGVTGFLGGAVLEKILTNAQSVELLLLARAGNPQSGLERVLENMRKFNVPEDKLASLKVDNILIGDLSQPEAFLHDPVWIGSRMSLTVRPLPHLVITR